MNSLTSTSEIRGLRVPDPALWGTAQAPAAPIAACRALRGKQSKCRRNAKKAACGGFALPARTIPLTGQRMPDRIVPVSLFHATCWLVPGCLHSRGGPSSEDEVDVCQCRRAVDVNEELGVTVTINIGGKQDAGRRSLEPEFTGGPSEGTVADEVEGVVAGTGSEAAVPAVSARWPLPGRPASHRWASCVRLP